MKLQLPWMDALRIEFALGYRVDITDQGVPRNMTRVSPFEEYKGEYFVKLWIEDSWEMMCHGLVEVGVLVSKAWYLWTLCNERDFYKSVKI